MPPSISNELIVSIVFPHTEHKDGFKQWRKKHYDEFRNIQRARMLLATEQDEDDDDEDEDVMDNVS